MSEKLESNVVDAVANSNFKNIAEAGAFYASLSMRDAVESQRRMSTIADNATGQLLKNFNEMDASQALALVKANTGFDRASQAHDLSRVLEQLGASLASLQIFAKVGQTTPPNTSA
jgi:hypothetical protein